MLRNLFVGLVVLFAAAAVYWGFSAKESKAKEKTSSSPVDGEGRVADLEQDILQMKKEMQRMSVKSELAARMSGGQIVTASEQESEHPEKGIVKETAEDFDDRMEEQRRSISLRFDELSNAHQKEARDPNWSDRAEAELSSIMQQLRESGIEGATVVGSECKSTMCRVDVAYSDPQTQSQVSGRIRSPFFGGGEARRFEEDGRLRSTTYIYRQGYDSPVP